MSQATDALFKKLHQIQQEIDARIDSPEVLATSTIDELVTREQAVIRSIVLAMSAPLAVVRLKAAAAAAQKAHAAYGEGTISLEERNAAVRAALDRRDEMITSLNQGLQENLRAYNAMLRERPELVAEFGIHDASALCSLGQVPG